MAPGSVAEPKRAADTIRRTGHLGSHHPDTSAGKKSNNDYNKQQPYSRINKNKENNCGSQHQARHQL